jgi:FkbM family methyltransferase
MNKKVFIDCGANAGQSIDNFIKQWNDWSEYDILSFEPNPALHEKFKKYSKHENIKFFPVATWIYDGDIDFYLSTQHTYGSSVLNTKVGNLTTPIQIKCVDLDKIIRQYSIDDYIILKIDIEGGEYELLEFLLSKNTFEYINVLYIEFHTHKVQKTKEDDKILLNALASYPNLKVISDSWNGLNFL